MYRNVRGNDSYTKMGLCVYNFILNYSTPIRGVIFVHLILTISNYNAKFGSLALYCFMVNVH